MRRPVDLLTVLGGGLHEHDALRRMAPGDLSATALWQLARVLGLVALALHADGRTIDACRDCGGEWDGEWCVFPDGSSIRVGARGQLIED